MSPLYAYNGDHPRMNWPSNDQSRHPASMACTHWMKNVQQQAKENLEQTKKSMGKYYDKKRLPHPSFKIGELVMLNAKNIWTKRPTKKPAPKLYGPFKILSKKGSHTHKLELLSQWRIHNVFHVSLLKPYRSNSITGCSQTRPELEEIKGKLEYEAQAILKSEIHITSSRRNTQ